jgi:16S rRNA (guanine966-N2)-methyltransferase
VIRVVAGEFGGRRLRTPPGAESRPTSERVREAVFAMLGPVEGLAVLDLFAGSGALGLEALSRGAARATFVERSPRAAAAIRANVAALGVEDRVRVLPRDWRAALAAERAAGSSYELCLLDPPYRLLPSIAELLFRDLAPLVPAGAMLVLEHAAGTSSPELAPLPIASRIDRLYGDTAVTLARVGTAL